jgi:hypothetical protein
MTIYEPSPIRRKRRTSTCLHVKARDSTRKMVMAVWTGIQNFCRGTPVPGCIIAQDEGGDALHSGVSTMCSYSPPPRALAIERQRSITDHSAKLAFMDTSC